MQERHAIEAESAARLLDALLSGDDLAEAVRGCLYGGPIFCSALFLATVQSRFRLGSDPDEITKLVTSIAKRNPGFPVSETETLIRFALGDLGLADNVDPMALDYAEIVILVLTAILSEWSPGRADVERLYKHAVDLVPAVADQPFLRDNIDDWYAMGMHTSPFSSLATAENSDSPEAITRQGSELLEAGQTEAAIEVFNRALYADPNYLQAIASRGRAYAVLGRYEQALEEFSRALEIQPTSAAALIDRGAAYRDLGRFDEALDDFAKAIELDKRWEASARVDRGIAYADMGRYADAIEEYSAALPVDENPESVLYQRGSAYYELDDFDRALDDISSAIKLNPKTHYLLFRGEVLRILERPLEALGDFDRVAEADFAEVWHLTSKADVLQDLGRLDEALQACEQAVAGWPGRTEPYLARGSVYVDLGRIAEAKADFRHALELDPDLADHVQELLESADGEAGQAAG